MKNVIIIYGGKSCEHDISILTACLARGYFADHNIYGVYMDKSNQAYLAPNNLTPSQHVNGKFKYKVTFLAGERAIGLVKGKRICRKVDVDVVVNCCHGAHGEDGTVSALCGLMDVPLVGSNITSSAIAMDKILCKQVLQSLQIPVIDGFEVNKGNLCKLNSFLDGYEFPVIVKPNTLGSSIGVKMCYNLDELSQNITNALKYDSRVLCERALTDFCELNCSAMRVRGAVGASKVDNPVTANDILTFADKYEQTPQQKADCPQVSDVVKQQVADITRRIYTQLNFSGVIRVDYLYDNAQGKLYVNEINSIPGSLAYGLWSDKCNMTQYGNLLVEQALSDYAEQKNLVTTFNSSVLTQGHSKGKK